MSDAKRLIWADSLKGYLIILVILGHAIQATIPEKCFDSHVWNIIYSFHMPAFMAVSGWFAYRPAFQLNVLNIYRRKFLQLLVPYFVWSLISFFIDGDYSINEFSKIILYPDSYFWFLWVLFWICIMFANDEFIAKKIQMDKLIPIGITCVLLFGLMVGFEIRVLGFQFIAYYFLLYTLGYCVHRFDIFHFSNKLLLGTMFCLWFVLAWFWNMHELPTWMPIIPHVPSALVQYAYRGFTALIAVLILLNIAPKLLNGESRFNIYMKSLGLVSLGLYVCHLTIIGYIFDIIRTVFPTMSSTYLIELNFVVTSILSICIVKLLKHNKFSSTLLLGKL